MLVGFFGPSYSRGPTYVDGTAGNTTLPSVVNVSRTRAQVGELSVPDPTVTLGGYSAMPAHTPPGAELSSVVISYAGGTLTKVN